MMPLIAEIATISSTEYPIASLHFKLISTVSSSVVGGTWSPGCRQAKFATNARPQDAHFVPSVLPRASAKAGGAQEVRRGAVLRTASRRPRLIFYRIANTADGGDELVLKSVV